MVSIRNRSGAALYVPSLRREVDADEVVDVPAPLAEPLVCQSIWEAVRAPKKAEKK